MLGGVCFQGASGIDPLSQGIRPASSPERGAFLPTFPIAPKPLPLGRGDIAQR
ncbi:hypothetical protein HMPREF9436_02345 [Faecalibacterium cf. prausnitzii KLE1255]|uniref:Uncharacterized protein n=1 Tax=Faecalibacterium cf. prausnitzii KLE1255 TaxID=748224 RepID=E2ZKZ2_9FIRM|nr:hypothetical protein HMPREF9436_02345 [Faecalibacterium cf. prausnitzii KLE1255]